MRFASARLRKDEALAFLSVQQAGQNLQYVDMALRKKRDFVLRCVQCHGTALRHADYKLRNDKEVRRSKGLAELNTKSRGTNKSEHCFL